jgi:hypothetical protein
VGQRQVPGHDRAFTWLPRREVHRKRAVRLGLEHIDDILWDLDQALAVASA